jgi:hypothetical protein
MLGSSKMSVGGLGIDAKVKERFKIIFEFSRRRGA